MVFTVFKFVVIKKFSQQLNLIIFFYLKPLISTIQQNKNDHKMHKEDLDILRPLFQVKRSNLSEKNQSDYLGNQIQKLSKVLTDFTQSLNNKMYSTDRGGSNKQYSSKLYHESAFEQESQPRFTYLKYPIQSIKKKPYAAKLEHMKKFCSSIARNILTKGFKWFQQGKMDQKKLRHFFCNNFIANIARYCSQNQLDQKQISQIDNHLKTNVFSFLQQRYPQNQTKQTNSKLQKMVTLVDNFGSNQNDLVYLSQIKFQYKENQDYSEEIMKFINYLLSLTRQPDKKLALMFQVKQQNSIKQLGVSQSQLQNNKPKILKDEEANTLYSCFYRQVQSIFQKLQNQQWVLKMLNDDYVGSVEAEAKFQSQKVVGQKACINQRYKKRVKQYTKYLIGQKLSSNVPLFSQKDIQERNFRVNDPGIMRILTKWCEQLQKNFEEVNINSRGQRFRMADGTQRNLKKDHRNLLYLQLNAQKRNLRQFLQKATKNIYQNQVHMFKNSQTLSMFEDFASEDQAITGYFATVMKKSYENYLVSYLNKLIHCILSAQENLKSRFNKKQRYKVAVNLISFKIGDLLRCKCSSKQTEIIALYNYLRGYCERNQNRLEIIRVKNRLSQSTRDILINLKFMNKIIVQMQLSINQQTSHFIKCSSIVKHFLYQIQRARFNPLIQICNIYSNVDPRAQFFKKKFQQINYEKLMTFLQEKNHSKQYLLPVSQKPHDKTHHINQINFPIWCDSCQRFISTLNLTRKHFKCQNCQQRKCASCLERLQCRNQVQINKDTYQSVAKPPNDEQIYLKLGQNSKIINNQLQQKPKQAKLIRKKVRVIDLNKKVKKERTLYLVYFNYKIMLFQLKQIKNKDRLAEKKREQKGENAQVIYVGQAKNNQQFQRLFAQKQVLSFDDANQIDQKNCKVSINNQILKQMIKMVKSRARKHFVFQQIQIDPSIFNKQNEMKSVQTVMINKLQIPSTSNLVEAFPKAKVILINKNKIKDLDMIEKWEQALDVNLQGNQIQLIPQKIKQLTHLQHLVLSKNKFNQFPRNLCYLKELKILNIKQNKLKSIDSQIHLLQNLQRLRLNQNEIEIIPNQIQGLKKLIQIDMSKNRIKKLPNQFKQLKALKKIIFQQNQISYLDENLFKQMPDLIRVDFAQNKLKQVPKSLEKKEFLSIIDFTSNQIQSIPQFLFQLPSLIEMSFTSNQVKVLNLQYGKNRSKLKKFYIDSNCLEHIPQQVFNINTIQRFKIGRNQIFSVPQQITQIQNLKQLFLQKMSLHQVPKILYEMSRLQTLSLQENNLYKLQSNFAVVFKEMRQLNLSYNQFEVIPSQVFDLRKLQILSLNNNKITKIPMEINKLIKLEKLKIENNKIMELPMQIKNLTHLQQVHINNVELSQSQITEFKKANSKIKFISNLNDKDIRVSRLSDHL